MDVGLLTHREGAARGVTVSRDQIMTPNIFKMPAKDSDDAEVKYSKDTIM